MPNTVGTNTSGHLFDTSFNTEGVLYSAASGVVTSTASGSSGQLLQSAGNASPPAYTTATYPATSGTSGTLLSSNGTNFVNTTATFPTASGGSGKILFDNGTNFVESTPTFPASASATTRKIIVSDGTNWTASTETYAVPGSSGNVLTSDGTNWTSAAPAGGLLVASGNLLNSQIKNLHATPIQIIAAPGSGKAIHLISWILTMNYGGTNAFTAGSSQCVQLWYGTAQSTSNNNTTGGITNSMLIQTASQLGGGSLNLSAVSTAVINYSATANTLINLYNPAVVEIGGNAANDNTISYNVLYRIITIP